MGPRSLAVGMADGEPIRLHPSHPLMHGGLRIHCDVDGDTITSARVEIGYVHRSAEKLLEVRDFRAGAMLANRHIWTAPTAGEYAFVLAAEELLGLPVSPRADQLRLIYCEIDRILSHLAFLAPTLTDEGLSPAREQLADLMAKVTGSRMHHHVIRIGGVAADFDAAHRSDLVASLDTVHVEIEELRAVPRIQAGRGIASLGSVVIDSFGLTGPIARAAGVARDLRSQGYGAYTSHTPVLGSGGDVSSRLSVLLDEIEQSITLVRSHLDDPRDGELLTRTPKNLRLPEGESYQAVEGPLGVEGVSLFSDGGLAPTRARLRTPSLAAFAALEAVLVGVALADIPLVLSTWPALSGDADR